MGIARSETLSNVIQFQVASTRLRADAPRNATSTTVATNVVAPQILDRWIELQTEAKSQIQRALSVIDVAISNVRKVENQIADRRFSKILNDRLTSIEETLQLAREKALDL
jgi:hypothetical protein